MSLSRPFGDAKRTEWGGSTLAERIKAAKEESGLSYQAIADAVREKVEGLKTTKSIVSNWANQEAVPEGRALAALPKVLGVDGHWLLTGEGTPDRKPGAEMRLEEIRRVLECEEGELLARTRLQDVAGQMQPDIEGHRRTDPEGDAKTQEG